MKTIDSTIAQQLAALASQLQEERTGHVPTAVTVVLGEDMLVFNLHDALTPAEKAMSKSAAGAAQVQDLHRQLFANSTAKMRNEIKRLTGRQVNEAVAEIETATGTVVHAFATGAMVQVFLLNQIARPKSEMDCRSIERADDEGLRVVPGADF